jgi:hypothetical protein
MERQGSLCCYNVDAAREVFVATNNSRSWKGSEEVRFVVTGRNDERQSANEGLAL